MVYDYFDDYDEMAVQKYYKKLAYEELFKVLNYNFSSLEELNVLEIACGNGSLTKLLVNSFGKVSAIDPNIAISENYPNLTKEKDYFHSDKDCSNYHILLSCSPCGIDEDIILTSKRYSLPFFIILCNCLHGFKTLEERYSYLKKCSTPSTTLYEKNSISFLTNLSI